MKYTEEEFYGMDFDLFFEFETTLGKGIMHVASNGEPDAKFLNLEVEDQEKLFQYFLGLKKSSKFTLTANAKKYPIVTSFTDWAKVGIYSFDTEQGKFDLVAVPETPLRVEDLPADIRKLLTKF